MEHLLKLIHAYLRRKLRELKPSFISVTVMVPPSIQHDLVDEYESRKVGDRTVVSFVKGVWPDETVLNFTPGEEDEYPHRKADTNSQSP